MTSGLRLTVILYALGVTAVCTRLAISGRDRTPIVNGALVMLQLGVVAQALVDTIAVTQGRHGNELGVHIAYLVTSLSIVPLAAASVRADTGRWGSATLAVGCTILAIVSLRLDQTLGQV